MQPGGLDQGTVAVALHGPADARCPQRRVASDAVGQLDGGDDVGDRQPPARPQDPGVDVRPSPTSPHTTSPDHCRTRSGRCSRPGSDGWDPDRALVIVRNPDQDPAEMLGRAVKIGYDHIAGELAGGPEDWTAATGRALSVGP